MAVISYDPIAAKSWSDKVLEYLSGEGVSVNNCSKSFREQIAVLVQPNVWTGPAAKKNYEDFLSTHKALIKFVNDFGTAFEEAMTSVNTQIGNMEAASGGGDSATSAFGSLTYDQLSELAEANIGTEVIRYDYAQIISISGELNKIKGELETVNSSLTNYLGQLDSGMNIWDGDAAAAAKEKLQSVLKKGMDEINTALNTCIENIKTAGESAQSADR